MIYTAVKIDNSHYFKNSHYLKMTDGNCIKLIEAALVCTHSLCSRVEIRKIMYTSVSPILIFQKGLKNRQACWHNVYSQDSNRVNPNI